MTWGRFQYVYIIKFWRILAFKKLFWQLIGNWAINATVIHDIVKIFTVLRGIFRITTFFCRLNLISVLGKSVVFLMKLVRLIQTRNTRGQIHIHIYIHIFFDIWISEVLIPFLIKVEIVVVESKFSTNKLVRCFVNIKA